MWSISLLAFVAINQIASSSAAGIYNTKVDRRQVKIQNYSYEGTIGPVNWHGIQPEYETCATGRKQSPINIVPGGIAQISGRAIQIDIPRNQRIKFFNDGTKVEVELEGTTTIRGKKFALKQFHYHTPGEHRINEEYYPAEVHLVHVEEDDPTKIAVIGFVFQLTCSERDVKRSPSAIFSRVLRSINRIPNAGDSISLPLQSLGPTVRQFTRAISDQSFYLYSGSLTTPPCSEGVTWIVAKEPLKMTVPIYNDLKKIQKFNSRFVQGDIGSQNLIALAADQLAALQ